MEKAYPHFKTRRVSNLDGQWDFSCLGKVDLEQIDISKIEFNEKMPVPAAFDAMPLYAGERGIAAYRKIVEVTPGFYGRIQFEAVSMWCRVYVDGVAIKEHGCGYSEFWCAFPLSDSAQREIVILVDNRFDLDRTPLHEPYYDFYQWGGIIRSVWLHEIPEIAFEWVRVTPVDYSTGQIEVEAKLTETPRDEISCEIELDGRHYSLVNFQPLSDLVSFSIQITQPRLWSVESPNLYELRLSIPGDDMIVRFGIRQVKAQGGKIYLNGQPVKLKGYNRHESHPNFGSALPLSILYTDLQILHDLGCNFIRGSHYQQDQRFLDLCDEQGFLFWEEALGWQPEERHFLNPNYVRQHYGQIEEMISTSYNHPSVIIWGFMNEAHTEVESAKQLFHDTIAFIKERDKSRLVTYATCRLKQDICLDPVDIIALNIYPGWYPGWGETFDEENPLRLIIPAIRDCLDFIQEKGMGDRAVIFSEIGADGIYGWHDIMKGHWTEEYQADYLNIVCREMMTNPAISGVSLWQYCDIRSASNFYALRRPRAFNNKGIVDEYRRPKLAYSVVKEWFRKS